MALADASKVTNLWRRRFATIEDSVRGCGSNLWHAVESHHSHTRRWYSATRAFKFGRWRQKPAFESECRHNGSPVEADAGSGQCKTAAIAHQYALAKEHRDSHFQRLERSAARLLRNGHGGALREFSGGQSC